MAIAVTKYLCEICNEAYDSMLKAKRCEAKGKGNTELLATYPIEELLLEIHTRYDGIQLGSIKQILVHKHGYAIETYSSYQMSKDTPKQNTFYIEHYRLGYYTGEYDLKIDSNRKIIFESV